MPAEEETRAHAQRFAERQKRLDSALKCLKLVRELVAMESVVDFGCGIGAWLEAARQLGAKSILGLEAEWVRNSETIIPQEKIRITDLANEMLTFSKQFDLAITIEVAEHLPEEAAERFCRGLTSAAPCILFSAAIPGQGGVNHINEQPLPYWVAKFWRLAYVPLDPIRPFIGKDKSILPWLRQNLVMFVDYDYLLRSDTLIRYARPLGDFALRYPL